MAYSSQALSSLLRRKRQYEAMGGTLTSAQTEGVVKGVLSTEAEREIQASRIASEKALRERSLELEKERLGIYGKAVESEKELAERRLSMEEEKMGDEELAGYLTTGVTLLGTRTGEKLLGKAGEAVTGIGKAIGIGGASATPAITTGTGAAAPSVLAGTGMTTIEGTAIPAFGEAGALTATAPSMAGAGMTTVEGATIPAAGEAGALTAVAPYAVPAIGGFAGGYVGSKLSQTKTFQELSPWGGKRTESAYGGALGGAAGGFMVGGPAGAAVGAAIGLGVGLFGYEDPVWEVEKSWDEKYAKAKKQFVSQYGEDEGMKQYTQWKYGEGGAKEQESKEKKQAKDEEESGTVICTELHRQGYINSAGVKYGTLFKNKIDDATYKGYYWWASRLVKLMKKSKVISGIVKPFGEAWIQEMKHQIRPKKYESNRLGKLLLTVGLPVCKFIGERRSKDGKLWKGFRNLVAKGIR